MKNTPIWTLVAASTLFFGACHSEQPPETAFRVGPRRLASIPAGESITIVQKMEGCYAGTEHRFQLTGGELITIEIDAAYMDLISMPGKERSSTRSESLELTRATVAKLDRYLDVYRARSPSAAYSDTVDILIEWGDGDETFQFTRIWDPVPESETQLSFFGLAKMAGADLETLRDG